MITLLHPLNANLKYLLELYNIFVFNILFTFRYKLLSSDEDDDYLCMIVDMLSSYNKECVYIHEANFV